jgi:aubergine-like protein
MRQHIVATTQIAVFILFTNRKDIYDTVKRFCCLDRPIPSQVILAKNLRDPRKAAGVMTKLTIQVNCKLGGQIWAVNIPVSLTACPLALCVCLWMNLSLKD